MKELKGQKFNHLLVLDDILRNGIHYCICKCDCGNEKEILATNIKRNHTKSCGCALGRSKNVLKPSLVYKTYRQALTYPPSNLKELDSIEYAFAKRWKRMISRAFEPNVKNYSARGINVCERWLNYFHFKEDMFESFKKHLQIHGIKNTTLDRIDVNGNYEPNNCRWATAKIQSRNKRNSLYVCFNNEKLSLNDAAEKIGIDGSKLYHLLKKYSEDEAIQKALIYVKQINDKILYNKDLYSLRELAEKFDIDVGMLRIWLIDKNLPIEKAIFHCQLLKGQDVELMYNNETKKLSEWCQELNLNKRIVMQRLLKGWDVDKTFTATIRNKNRMKI